MNAPFHFSSQRPRKTKNRIYILPTRFGLVFVTGAVVMILIGAGYQNNLVNLLAYFMLSLVFISMIQTQNNLKDISVAALETEGGFAGRDFLVTTIVANGSREPRFNLETGLKRQVLISLYENVHPVLPQSNLKLRASFAARTRGRHQVREVKVSSMFPLGLFRAWCWYKIESDVFIYPEPKGDLPLPLRGVASDAGVVAQFESGEDFHGHRKFQEGDSARHIDWKAHARGRPLLIKEFKDGAPQSTLLDWNSLSGLESEARLSQLSKWIEDARRAQIPFGLRLPHRTFPPGHGALHSIQCLKALAEYKT
jgi:uncharacterized protein (DUF58 family)